MYCTHCGTKLDDNARFCTNCGAPISAGSTPPAEPVKPKPVQVSAEPAVAPRKKTSTKKPQFKKQGGGGGRKGLTTLFVVALVGFVGYLAYDHFVNGDGDNHDTTVTTKPYFHLNDKEKRESPDLSKITGNKYNVDIPAEASSQADQFVTEALNSSMLEDIKAEGANPFGTAVSVTLKGKTDDSPIYLDDYATLSFDIPKEMTVNDYDRILGFVYNADAEFPHKKLVLMTPDSKEFANGKIVFHTSHFSKFGLTYGNDDLVLDRWLEQASVVGWEEAEYTADVMTKMKEQIAESLSSIGIGKDDLGGKLLKEAISDNTYLSALVDVMHGDDPDEKVNEIIKNQVAQKIVGKLFDRLNENPNDKEAIKTLKDNFNVDNANSIAEAIGRNEDVSDKFLKITSEVAIMIITNSSSPIKFGIKAIKMGQIAADFWADSNIEEKYQEYKAICNQHDGRMGRDEWDILTANNGMAGVFRYTNTQRNLSEANVRAQFEKRFRSEKKIAQQRKFLEYRIERWYELDLFDRSHPNLKFFYGMSMSDRLRQLSRLTQRFSDEFMVNGNIPNRGTLSNEYVLADIVHEYLLTYPDNEAFYRWIDENKYREPVYKNGSKKNSKSGAKKDGTNGAWVKIATKLEISDHLEEEEKATPAELQHTVNYNLYLPDYKEWHKAKAVTTCNIAPPDVIHAEDSVVFHVVVDVYDIQAAYTWSGSGDINFDLASQGLGGRSYQAIRAKRRRQKGEDMYLSTFDGNKHAECDYVQYFRKGKPGERCAINFEGTKSRTHWVYEWRE